MSNNADHHRDHLESAKPKRRYRRKLVHVRFDEIRKPSGGGADVEVEVARCDLPDVPLIGETINLKGNPYVVCKRGWAVGEDGEEAGILFAYLKVTRFGNWKD